MITGNLLIVDDEELIRTLLREYFRGLGYNVMTSEGGKDAFLKFDKFEVDCIISDLSMPDMDGLELLKRIRVHNKSVPILIITGYPSVESAVEAMKNGAYDFISKPLHLEDIRWKVERAMHTKALEKSRMRINSIMWAILISIPLWLILGIVLGKIWR